MEEEVPFEAEHVLQELYNLDAVVQGVQAGTWERYTRLPSLNPLPLPCCCVVYAAFLLSSTPLFMSFTTALLLLLLVSLLLLLLLWLLLLNRRLCGCAAAEKVSVRLCCC